MLITSFVYTHSIYKDARARQDEQRKKPGQEMHSCQVQGQRYNHTFIFADMDYPEAACFLIKSSLQKNAAIGRGLRSSPFCIVENAHVVDKGQQDDDTALRVSSIIYVCFRRMRVGREEELIGKSYYDIQSRSIEWLWHL